MPVLTPLAALALCSLLAASPATAHAVPDIPAAVARSVAEYRATELAREFALAVDDATAARAVRDRDTTGEAKRDSTTTGREKRRRAQEEAARPKYVSPAAGVVSSGFGERWGTTHFGVDIANQIGTPILAVTDGTVVEAGPAAGFGLWIRLRHADGTITVYGHMDRLEVRTGQTVTTGARIATMGSRGQSTGPHLHFEVWADGSVRIDPLPWLAARGVSL